MPTDPDAARPGAQLTARDAELARLILAAIHGLRYGCVEIVIHDAQVVQIQRTERMRLTQGQSPPRR